MCVGWGVHCPSLQVAMAFWECVLSVGNMGGPTPMPCSLRSATGTSTTMKVQDNACRQLVLDLPTPTTQTLFCSTLSYQSSPILCNPPPPTLCPQVGQSAFITAVCLKKARICLAWHTSPNPPKPGMYNPSHYSRQTWMKIHFYLTTAGSLLTIT